MLAHERGELYVQTPSPVIKDASKSEIEVAGLPRGRQCCLLLLALTHIAIGKSKLDDTFYL